MLAGFLGSPAVKVPLFGVAAFGNTVIVSYTHGLLVNPLTVSTFLMQYTYTPGVVGTAGAVVVQLLPVLSQYIGLLPAGMVDGSIVPAMLEGLLGSPAVKVPSLAFGKDGNTLMVS